MSPHMDLDLQLAQHCHGFSSSYPFSVSVEVIFVIIIWFVPLQAPSHLASTPLLRPKQHHHNFLHHPHSTNTSSPLPLVGGSCTC